MTLMSTEGALARASTSAPDRDHLVGGCEDDQLRGEPLRASFLSGADQNVESSFGLSVAVGAHRLEGDWTKLFVRVSSHLMSLVRERTMESEVVRSA